jgi:hypothetical protein
VDAFGGLPYDGEFAVGIFFCDVVLVHD